MTDNIPRAKKNADAVYGSNSRNEIEAVYDKWAKDYDQDAKNHFGYLGPEMAFERFQRFVSKDAHILDAGAGTGRLGELLSEAGYTNLTGFDLSLGMLKVAEERRVYQTLHHMALGETLGFADNEFSATACIGTLTTGHAPAESIDELVRVTRPDGLLILSLNLDTYGSDGIKDRVEKLLAEGHWTLVEASGPIKIMPVGEPEMNHDIRVYRAS